MAEGQSHDILITIDYHIENGYRFGNKFDAAPIAACDRGKNVIALFQPQRPPRRNVQF